MRIGSASETTSAIIPTIEVGITDLKVLGQKNE